MAIQITEKEGWVIELGDSGSLKERLVVDAPMPKVPRFGDEIQKIVVHLRRQRYDPLTGKIEDDKAEGYQIVRGQEHKHFDGTQMQEKDDLGNLVFEEDGVTPVMGRTQAYERVIYALENGLFTKQTLLDGIKEYYKID
jgi:hypothetical protein